MAGPWGVASDRQACCPRGVRARGGVSGGYASHSGAADFTLRQGIESIIRRGVPEIRQIIDITDHATGKNPYYRRPAGR